MQLTPHFRLSEFNCACCGNGDPVTAKRMAELLELVRPSVGPIVIRSGFRCKRANRKAGGKDNSYHLLGLAVDISVTSDSRRHALIWALMLQGWKRLGVGKNIIHADRGPTRKPVIWTYY